MEQLAENIHEEWKPIVGHEGLYDVSSLGRVRSIYFSRDKVLKISVNKKSGYCSISLSKRNEKSRKYYVHILVAKAFIPNPSNKKTVNHKYGNKLDNRVSELEWATHSENKIDAFLKGISETTKGEQTWTSKLTEKDVLEIRKLWSEGCISRLDLSEKFKVEKSTIINIINGKIWRHVGGKIRNEADFKKVILNLSTGIFYDSITEAAEAKGINNKTLRNHINGRNKKNKTDIVLV